MTSFIDRTRGAARIALEQDGLLLAALFVSSEPVAVMRDYLAGLPGTVAAGVLAGCPPANAPNPGPLLCACFGVGINIIVAGIESGTMMRVEAVGAALEAGTNCGSCRPEIAALLARVQDRKAAE